MSYGGSPVRLRVENVWTYVEGYFKDSVKKEVDARLSYMLPDAEFAIRGWEAKKRKELCAKYGRKIGLTMELPYRWDGRFRFYEGKNRRFPTGFFGKVRKIMLAHNQEYSVLDLRAKPDPSLRLETKGLVPFPDQTEIVDLALAQQRGIVDLATGGGKTEIIAMLLARLKTPAVILIHRETIFQQLIERLSARLGVKVGSIGAGKDVRSNINVAMTQTVQGKKYTKLLQAFPTVIADECHHVPADTIYSVLQTCEQSFYRFGFTATPKRADGKEMFLEAAFGGFICQRTASDLIRAGRLTRPFVHFVDIPADEGSDLLSWQAQYKRTIVENEYRNRAVIGAAYTFWKLKKSCLIAVTQINHGEALLKMLRRTYPGIKACFIQGEDESTAKQATLKKLGRKEIDVVIATSVFGEGIDVPSLDALINAKGQDSATDVIQLAGRCLRKVEGKDRAFFVDFYDQNFYTKPHSMNRYNVLKAQSEFVMARHETPEAMYTAIREDLEKSVETLPVVEPL